jgi:hypothetical protein
LIELWSHQDITHKHHVSIRLFQSLMGQAKKSPGFIARLRNQEAEIVQR